MKEWYTFVVSQKKNRTYFFICHLIYRKEWFRKGKRCCFPFRIRDFTSTVVSKLIAFSCALFSYIRVQRLPLLVIVSNLWMDGSCTVKKSIETRNVESMDPYIVGGENALGFVTIVTTIYVYIWRFLLKIFALTIAVQPKWACSKARTKIFQCTWSSVVCCTFCFGFFTPRFLLFITLFRHSCPVYDFFSSLILRRISPCPSSVWFIAHQSNGKIHF